MLFEESPSHQLGVIGIVCDVHPLRSTKTSRDMRPLPGVTTVSSSPWKPMYATRVVPLLRGNELIGVLDLDSPKFARFDAEDQAGLEKVVAEVLKAL